MDPSTLATAATAFLSPYLVKAGEKAAETVGEKLPEVVGKVWNAIMATFKGKPAAEEASKDLVANPENEDNHAAFRKELRKVLEAEPTLAIELTRLLEKAQRESSESIIVTGSGAAATKDSVAAGAGGVAVRGDVNVALPWADRRRKNRRPCLATTASRPKNCSRQLPRWKRSSMN